MLNLAGNIQKKRILMKLATCLLLVFMAMGSTVNGPGKEMDLYLLIGQSNMAGRGEITEELRDTLSRVFLFTNDSLDPWQPAANPLNKYSTVRKRLSIQELGPGYTFARRMALESEDKAIGLIVNARGGTGIREWLPGTELYTQAVKRTLSAMDHGDLRGILWLQGESDRQRVDTYPAELDLLISALRDDLGNEKLPVVVCELSEDKPGREKFNLMLHETKEKISRFSIVETSDLSTTDSTHFDTSSQVLIGERFASEMIGLLESTDL